MVSTFAVVALSTNVAISHALNSAQSTISLTADAGQVEVDEDDVSLLQSSANVTQKQHPTIEMPPAGHPLFNHLTHADVDFGSFISEDYVHCIMGDFHDSETAHSLMRASPVTSLFYSGEYHEGITCASLGYDVLYQEQDDCWHIFSRWVRPGTPNERARYGTANGGLWTDVIDLYDRDHGYPEGTSREWVACGICTAGSLVRTESWGSGFSCANALESEPRVLANMRQATDGDGNAIPRGSITPNTALVCFEGSIATLEDYLERTLRTPLGTLFSDSVISEQNCEERGFDMPRDLIDECWADTAKIMRTDTETEDLTEWIAEYVGALHGFDSTDLSGGHWNTRDWVACNACFPGGAVRGRGLWTTMHGGDSLPYTDTFCRAAGFPENMP